MAPLAGFRLEEVALPGQTCQEAEQREDQDERERKDHAAT